MRKYWKRLAAGFLASFLPAAAPASVASFSGKEPPPSLQAPAPSLPHTGVRQSGRAPIALVGATVQVRPDRKIEGATLLIRNGKVEAVGPRLSLPPDATVIEVSGKTIYPGFIDPFTEYGLESRRPESSAGNRTLARREAAMGRTRQAESSEKGARSWNEAVHAERLAAEDFQPEAEAARKLLARGVTTVATVKRDGIFRGRAAVVSTHPTGRSAELFLRVEGPHHASFERGSSNQLYPTSLMGSMALIRQTLLDARWALEISRLAPPQNRPEVDLALQELARAFYGKPTPEALWFETGTELNLLRAARLGQEAEIALVFIGSGFEWRRLEEITAIQPRLVLPVRLPERPAVDDPLREAEVPLVDLRHFERAPFNPLWLSEKGVELAWTGTGLGEKDDFWTTLRRFVDAGLPEAVAIAGLTTVPAKWLGVQDQVGTLEPGFRADLVITSGSLFDKEARILEVWIGGSPVHQLEALDQLDARGRYAFQLDHTRFELSLEGKTPLELRGKIVPKSQDSEVLTPAETEASKEKGREASVSSLTVERRAVTFHTDLGKIGGPSGRSRFRLTAPSGTLQLELWPPGQQTPTLVVLEKLSFEAGKEQTATPSSKPTLRSRRTYPDAPYGYETPPQAESVVVRNATIWTSGPQGKLEQSDLYVHGGKVVAVGKNLKVPKGTREIDGTGRHITPGLIDEHSHLAISGGVNEASHAVTAEVRISDVLDPDDIGIFRALAGGTTAAQLLHGSANPIGGQGAIIKHRWGRSAPELLIPDARPTIKFALGENVKQSNWTDPSDRYPKTRMGVDTRIRDAFLAAREYRAAWERYRSLPAAARSKTAPPRRDLTLEPLAEILEGKRDIHCHSYVQSEILSLMRLAEELGFRVHTFTHILEGYKVAPEMARHRAMASSFADWWAYKFEVYDAIPQNTCLMHDAGIVVSVNSDSEEMIRRLNQEASKSILYCGMGEEEALKLVTLNPAKQLGIDHRVGSLEPGKDADFVIWNGHPLSTLSYPIETWIDGQRYFSIEQAEEQRRRDLEERRALIDWALSQAEEGGTKGLSTKALHPTERWECGDLHGLNQRFEKVVGEGNGS